MSGPSGSAAGAASSDCRRAWRRAETRLAPLLRCSVRVVGDFLSHSSYGGRDSDPRFSVSGRGKLHLTLTDDGPRPSRGAFVFHSGTPRPDWRALDRRHTRLGSARRIGPGSHVLTHAP